MCLYHFVSFHCHNGIAQLLLTVALLRNLNCLWKLCSVNQPGSTTGCMCPRLSVSQWPIILAMAQIDFTPLKSNISNRSPNEQNLHKCNFVEFDGLKGRRRLSSYQVLCVTPFQKKKKIQFIFKILRYKCNESALGLPVSMRSGGEKTDER